MQTSNRDPGDRRRSSESITEKFVGFLPPEQVTVTSRLSELQVETPSVTVFPLNIEELAAVMRIAGAENLRVLPSGAGTWLEMGNAPRDPNLVVSTARMNRVLEYEPADLTATVEAGCTLSAFNTRALSHRQFIPLDPSGSDASTIGAVAATASYGPLRCAYGTPRDWIIGMRIVHAGGTITKAGGKVVKNVAGYDLCKLYTGSYGTLGIIGELSVKLRARPSGDRTVLLYSSTFDSLLRVLAAGHRSDLQPAAAEIFSTSSMQHDLKTDIPFALAMRFLAEAETIESQFRMVSELTRDTDVLQSLPDQDSGEAFWSRYASTVLLPEWSYILRIGALPSQISQVVDEIERLAPGGSIFCHAANGVVRVHARSDWLSRLKTAQRPRRISELRQLAQQRGGSLIIERAPDEIRTMLDVWGEAGMNARLMREVKAKFDPLSLLNPGRFVAGI